MKELALQHRQACETNWKKFPMHKQKLPAHVTEN